MTTNQSTQRSPEEIRREFARRRRYQIQFRVVMIFFAVVAIWLGSPGAQVFRQALEERQLDWVFLALALGTMVIAMLSWRCPACNALLGRRVAQRSCPKCGANFETSDAG